MSTIKKDMLTADGEWRKHLRPYGKHQFWRGEREAGKREAERQMQDAAENYWWAWWNEYQSPEDY